MLKQDRTACGQGLKQHCAPQEPFAKTARKQLLGRPDGKLKTWFRTSVAVVQSLHGWRRLPPMDAAVPFALNSPGLCLLLIRTRFGLLPESVHGAERVLLTSDKRGCPWLGKAGSLGPIPGTLPQLPQFGGPPSRRAFRERPGTGLRSRWGRHRGPGDAQDRNQTGKWPLRVFIPLSVHILMFRYQNVNGFDFAGLPRTSPERLRNTQETYFLKIYVVLNSQTPCRPRLEVECPLGQFTWVHFSV